MDPPLVELHFGPYESHGLIRHQELRLRGITDELFRLGYEVTYKASIHLNRLTVKMKNHEVFRCDIRHLLFNMEYEDDKVGHRLIAAVEEAFDRFFSDVNVPNFGSVDGGLRSLQKERDATSLQELMVEDVQVMYEIPLHLVKNSWRKPNKMLAENRERAVQRDVVMESQMDVRKGEMDQEDKSSVFS